MTICYYAKVKETRQKMVWDDEDETSRWQGDWVETGEITEWTMGENAYRITHDNGTVTVFPKEGMAKVYQGVVQVKVEDRDEKRCIHRIETGGRMSVRCCKVVDIFHPAYCSVKICAKYCETQPEEPKEEPKEVYF